MPPRGDKVGRATELQSTPAFITIDEFAEIARISRRTLCRLRQSRPAGFPTEYDLGLSAAPTRNCRRPRFKLAEVQAWLDSRALW